MRVGGTAFREADLDGKFESATQFGGTKTRAPGRHPKAVPHAAVAAILDD
jgi:hypothetical protein